MKKVLIGSTAIKELYPDFKREPKDIDWAVSIISRKSNRTEEYLINPVFCDFVYTNTDDNKATGDMLYTLKLSHMFWDINWNKHLYDIQWLKKRGCVIIPHLFNELYKYWNNYHNKNKRSDLKMTSAEFFDNALKSDYEHDWLHTLINPIPTYTKILKDGAEVEVSEEKFKTLSFEEKCNLVREEVYIMAWERMPKLDYRIAYEKMLKKFIISHAPIWEALFILDNYQFLYKPIINYFKILNNGTKFIKN